MRRMLGVDSLKSRGVSFVAYFPHAIFLRTLNGAIVGKCKSFQTFFAFLFFPIIKSVQNLRRNFSNFPFFATLCPTKDQCQAVFYPAGFLNQVFKSGAMTADHTGDLENITRAKRVSNSHQSIAY